MALYSSLVKTGDSFVLWILCFDEETYQILGSLNLPNTRLISEQEFEKNDEALIATKGSRTRVEYYWTCTASLPLYIFRQDNSIPVLIYLDADTFFYSSPKTILEELGEKSILIVPHDYSPEFEDKEAGIYNVGIMAFRPDQAGLSCLNWWRERCIEWCYWKYENGQIGDQAYLNDWPERFDKVVVSNNIGINAAPWNVAKYGLSADNNGNFFIADKPLVCFHFHALRFCSSQLVYMSGFNVNLPTSVLNIIYRPYINSLIEARNMIFNHNFKIEFTITGIPWRYIAGRLIRRQPLKHFMWVKKREIVT